MASSLSPPSISPSSPQPLNLESELSCAICTEILYQPLTLLDCLHTFCGSCLKEWFSQSATSGRHTCPSCRAPVRDTKPNATVTCLLDLYLQANPSKTKPDEEKKELASKYSPGEKILRLPEQRSLRSDSNRAQQDAEEDDDRRLLQEIRELSLRDVDGGRPRATSRDRQRRQHGQRVRADGRSGSRRRDLSPHAAAREELHHQLMLREGLRPGRSLRTLEHQHSLRSLLHTAGSDAEVSQAVQQDILRQINEGGLLDGIDTSDIDVHNEDAIPEMIARAYLRRREEQAEQRRRDRVPNSATSRNADSDADSISTPPVSRPHLINASNASRSPRPRSSSQASSRSATRPEDPRSSGEDVTHLSPRQTRTRIDTSAMRTAAPQPRQRSYQARTPESGDVHADERARSLHVDLNAPSQSNLLSSPRLGESRSPARQRASLDVSTGRTRHHRSRSREDRATTDPIPADISSPQPSPSSTVPSISCSSCSRSSIEHDLHYICSRCTPTPGNANFALCRRCYLSGKGCLNWAGFGTAAKVGHKRQSTAAHVLEDGPHRLRAERYTLASGNGSSTNASTHETGLFCALCYSHANTCYWRCPTCNAGEWGFCNICVNQARHCTHPLLALGADDIYNNNDTPSTQQARLPSTTSLDLGLPTTPLPITTVCNACQTLIAPGATYYHCPTCNGGDYDLCNACYTSLVPPPPAGSSLQNNSSTGWRKCPHAHRMLVLRAETRPDGQWRHVVADVVGGWQLKDEDATPTSAAPTHRDGTGEPVDGDATLAFSWLDTTSGTWRHKRAVSGSGPADGSGGARGPEGPRQTATAMPPSGGAGHAVVALWTRQPGEDVQDELAFPRGAEVRECFEINDGWSWGVYCRAGGMFPSAFGRLVR